MRVVGYIRVSTSEQARDGVSLDAQRAKIRQFCNLHNLTLVALCEDPGISAKSLDRPGLSSALARLDQGLADGIVVAKLDRLTRSLADWDRLIRSHFGPGGKTLLSVADSIDTRTAGGRMVLNLFVLIAQWEREIIQERTQEALDHKRSRGERLGQVPFGARVAADGVTLEPDSAEAEALADIVALRREGSSLREIGRAMEARGIRPKRGGRWSPESIRQLLIRAAEAESEGVAIGA